MSAASISSEEQAAALLKGAEETPLYIPVLLAVSCGMRRGEILGLKWDNIDFEAKTIHIINNLTKADGKSILGKPKTDAGKRTITAPDITIKALKEAKKKQAVNKLALGTQHHDNGFVCCWDDGTPYRPDYITHAFPKLLERLKLPVVRFHDLRYTHATLLFRQGVHPKIV